MASSSSAFFFSMCSSYIFFSPSFQWIRKKKYQELDKSKIHHPSYRPCRNLPYRPYLPCHPCRPCSRRHHHHLPYHPWLLHPPLSFSPCAHRTSFSLHPSLRKMFF